MSYTPDLNKPCTRNCKECTYTNLCFDKEPHLLNLEEEKLMHLETIRQQAAIAAMQGIMGFFGSLDYNKETIAKLAVEQADALVEKLKGG